MVEHTSIFHEINFLHHSSVFPSGYIHPSIILLSKCSLAQLSRVQPLATFFRSVCISRLNLYAHFRPFINELRCQKYRKGYRHSLLLFGFHLQERHRLASLFHSDGATATADWGSFRDNSLFWPLEYSDDLYYLEVTSGP